jgi:hypothetical protein
MDLIEVEDEDANQHELKQVHLKEFEAQIICSCTDILGRLITEYYDLYLDQRESKARLNLLLNFTKICQVPYDLYLDTE